MPVTTTTAVARANWHATFFEIIPLVPVFRIPNIGISLLSRLHAHFRNEIGNRYVRAQCGNSADVVAAQASHQVSGQGRINEPRGRGMARKSTTGDITRLLTEWTSGRPEPAPELWSIIYRELRQIAGAYMRNER